MVEWAGMGAAYRRGGRAGRGRRRGCAPLLLWLGGCRASVKVSVVVGAGEKGGIRGVPSDVSSSDEGCRPENVGSSRYWSICIR